MARSQTSGRVDDNIETIKKRFLTYQNDTMPIIEKYDQEQKVKKIDSTVTVDEVFAKVCEAFAPLEGQAGAGAQKVVTVTTQHEDKSSLDRFDHPSHLNFPVIWRYSKPPLALAKVLVQ